MVVAVAGGGKEEEKVAKEEPKKQTEQAVAEPKKEEPKKEEPKKEEPKKKDGISKAEFEQIQNDMSYEEVKAIIGNDGELQSESTVGEYTSKLYTWKGESGFGANANVTFQNNKVMAKAQFGLK